MDLNHLSNTAPPKDDVDFNNLPEQMGGFTEPPQPGPFRFEMPTTLSGANFEEYESAEGKYLRVKFDQNAPLTIVQSLQGAHNGEPFTTRLTNQPRKRGKGEDAPKASDLDYLLQATGAKARPKGNKAWAEAILALGAAKTQFAADIEYSWRCDPNKAIYADDGAGGLTEVPAQMGCDNRWYQKDVPKVEGKFPYRITCPCGASVRAFANPQRFRA